MHYVYVLSSSTDSKFYIGFTKNLKRRVKEHKYGKVRSTNERGEMTLIYYEAHISKVDALRRESYFKSSKGRTSLRLMLRDALG